MIMIPRKEQVEFWSTSELPAFSKTVMFSQKALTEASSSIVRLVSEHLMRSRMTNRLNFDPREQHTIALQCSVHESPGNEQTAFLVQPSNWLPPALYLVGLT